jgi:glycosyltransferase involved in cell wall biosynthesis
MRQSGPGTRTRILYLIDHALSTGGAERFAVGLATHLRQDRFEPWVCSTRGTDAVAEATLAAAGVSHISLGRVAKWDVHKFAGLVRLLRRERFDLLHSHMFGSNLWGSTIGTACHVPVIVAQEHSWSFEGNPVRAWVDGNVIGRLADRFVAVSRADGERMVTREGVRADKVEVISNGYIPSPASSATDVRAELGIDRDVPVVAIAAVLRPEKRLELLLEAFAEVLRALPRAQLLLAGDGPCRRMLENQARELGLDGHVHFLGFRGDVDSVLRAADVGALSSDREGSPLLMFECMANDTPFVATAVGGVPDVIEDGRTGVLVPRRDPDAMARALIGILTDPDRAHEIAAAAREEVNRFTIDTTAERFATLYDTLLGTER